MQAAAGFQIGAVPTFFAVNREGKPTGTVKVGVDEVNTSVPVSAIGSDFANVAAPGLKAFFEKSRKEFTGNSR